MKLPLIRHRVGRILAVTLALAGWLGGGYWFMRGGHLFETQGWEQRIGWHLSGIVSFFVLALFLPEERKARSPGRKGALQMMAFVLWLLATDLLMHFKELQEPAAGAGLLLGAPVLAYFVCLFMIRGFRAVPEYEQQVEVKSSGTEGVGPAPVPVEKAEETKSEEKEETASPLSDDSRAGGLLEKLEEPATGRS